MSSETLHPNQHNVYVEFDPPPITQRVRAWLDSWDLSQATSSRKVLIGAIMVVSLLAFEVFNFDTTRYALSNFLGGVDFLSVSWAAILAVAFCAIDFAGLVRIFTPQRGDEEPKAVWYLMGAWFLGATMNAIMTWWAVSLTLLNHDFGNEVLSRAQLLKIVPVFVAVLVWLTRILFIGALGVAGERLLTAQPENPVRRPETVARRAEPVTAPAASATTAARTGASAPTAYRQVARIRERELTPMTVTKSAERHIEPEPTLMAGPALAPEDQSPKRDHPRVRQRPPRMNGAPSTTPIRGGLGMNGLNGPTR